MVISAGNAPATGLAVMVVEAAAVDMVVDHATVVANLDTLHGTAHLPRAKGVEVEVEAPKEAFLAPATDVGKLDTSLVTAVRQEIAVKASLAAVTGVDKLDTWLVTAKRRVR